MDALYSLNSMLKEIVQEIEDGEAKDSLIFQHIKNIARFDFVFDDFPKGLDWFNTTEPLTKKHLEGKIVLLDFFTYCCINCLHILPYLRELEENFSVADGLVVIGVHSAKFENEKNSSNISAAIKRYNITHPVVNDKNGILWNKFDIACWPTLLMLGPHGHPLFVLVGEGHRDELLLYVRNALKFYKNELSSHCIPITRSDAVVTSSLLHFPGKIANYENIFAVSDSGHHQILIINNEGVIQFRIGATSPGFKDGDFETARFNSPQGVAFYDSTLLYVADTENHAIRLINLKTCEVITVAGNGNQGTDYAGGKIGHLQEISSPWDVVFVSSGDIDLPAINPAFPILTVSASVNEGPSPPTSGPPLPPPPPSGPPLPPPMNATAPKKEINGKKVLLIAMSGTHQIWALFVDDTTWWKGKEYKKNSCVAIAGSGKEENRNNRYPMAAGFAQPSGLAYNPELKCVFVADSESSSIRMLSLKDGSVSHVAGGDKSPENLFSYGDADGRSYDAKFQHPLGVAWNRKNQTLYLCDTYNHKIKKINALTSVSESLKHENHFNEPSGCCFDRSDDILYITNTNNHSITKLKLSDNSLEKWNIREESKSTQNQPTSNKWKLEAAINPDGGNLTLKIKLQPDDIHGKWNLDLKDSKIQTVSLKGKVTSELIMLNMIIPKSDLATTISFLFDVVVCENEACILKKCILDVLINRVENSKESVEIEFLETVR